MLFRLRPRAFLNTSLFALFILYSLMTPVRGEGLMVSLVPVDAEKMAIIPREDIRDWNTNYDLVDTSWTSYASGPGGIGFDNSGYYYQYITLDIGPEMQGQQSTCYIRAKFNLTSDLINELDYLTMGVRYDDGFIAYLNGERVAFANAPNDPGWRSSASQPHEAQSMIWFDISEHVDKLKSGDNLFAVHAMNVERGSPDFLIQFELLARKNYERNFVSELPIVKINSDGHVPVNATTTRDGDIQIINNGTGNEHRLLDAANDYSGRLSITENSTIYGYPKNHYYISLKDETGKPQNGSLLGLPDGDEWTFYAPYNDKTILRTAFMAELAHQMGRGGSPRLCHLFLNDNYMGIYVLLETNNRHANRINVAEPGDDGDALSGGYILELSKDRDASGFDSPIDPFFNAQYPIRYLYTFPNTTNLTSAQEEYIQNFMKGFETNVVNTIDIASAVDYFLLNETAKNIDAYRDHTILFKDRDSIDPHMFIKSVLDFNNACGNTQVYSGNAVKGWQFDYLTKSSNLSSDSMYVPQWWQQLYKDVNFTRALYKRWESVSESIFSEDFMVTKLDSLYHLLKNDGILNFERWPVAGKPIEPFGKIGDTFDEDFDYFYIWVIDRLDWMREAMEDFQTNITTDKTAIPTFRLAQNYPNPFNPQTTISYQLPKSSYVSLRIFDVRGVQVSELVARTQSAGTYNVQWDATGYPSGIYWYELVADEFTQTKRMLLIR